VIGDFQGDAAMGFWGWPLPQPNAALLAAQTALGIRAEFENFSRQRDHSLADFRVGIGLASGRAVAGKIGTTDQVQVTVFGPVVNLAQRLESMTRHVPASILIDEATAQKLKGHLSPAIARLRSVATIKPFGMTQPVTVSELLPSAAACNEINDESIAIYEKALQHFNKNEWQASRDILNSLPQCDSLAQFLLSQINLNADGKQTVSDGVIVMTTK
jgi:adenylate cyclase